jgi:ribosomal protein S18 acetylase RimI-like enzyme
MSLPADLTLREATLDDLAAVAALRESVGWGVHEWALRAVIGQIHARCVVVVDPADVVVAVGSGIVYGPLGFVGNMVVADSHRRQGIGSVVLVEITSSLEAAGCRRLELNATSEGRLLYERHGFSTIGTSATATLGRDVTLHPDSEVAVRRGDARLDIDALATYDRPRFGGDRRALLELLGRDPAARFLVAEGSGQVAGYACLRDDPPRIGPFLAETPDIAAALMTRAFAEVDGVDALRINLPPNNRPGAAWLRAMGIDIEPWDGRMGRGPQVPRRDETVYGMAVGALG